MNSHEKANAGERNDALALMICAGCALWALSIPLLSLFYDLPNTAAGFGSMFGAVNALFSGMALAGIVYTVCMQQREIRTNQEQMAKSIHACEMAARAMAYSGLLQDCHNSLTRYEAWEQSASQLEGDEKDVALMRIQNARSTVHASINVCRAKLQVIAETMHRDDLAEAS